MTSPTDSARFAHWIDLNEMDHIGVDSSLLWRELDTLEAIRGEIPPLPEMPKVGDHVYVRCSNTVLLGSVIAIYPDKYSGWGAISSESFMVDTKSGRRYCTLADIVVPEQTERD